MQFLFYFFEHAFEPTRVVQGKEFAYSNLLRQKVVKLAEFFLKELFVLPLTESTKS